MEIILAIVFVVIGIAVLAAIFGGSPTKNLEDAQARTADALEALRSSMARLEENAINSVKRQSEESPEALKIYSLSNLGQIGSFDNAYKLCRENYFNIYDKCSLLYLCFYDQAGKVDDLHPTPYSVFVKDFCLSNMTADAFARSFGGEGSDWESEEEALEVLESSVAAVDGAFDCDEASEADNLSIEYVSEIRSTIDTTSGAYADFLNRLDDAIKFDNLSDEHRLTIMRLILD
ncbi:hypothetical protein OAS19_05360 [Altererythrobacter sp.]|nr:hypothetical protein [Altererythrobacter sp.]